MRRKLGVVVVKNMTLDAVGQRGMLSGKFSLSPDYCSFALAIEPAYITPDRATGSVVSTRDHRAQAVDQMEFASLSNFERNVRQSYSRDEFGYARDNALGFTSKANHAGSKFLSRVVVSLMPVTE